MQATRRRGESLGWTAWHVLAFWAIWFAIASGVSWIIIGAAIWRTMIDHLPPSPSLVAGRIPRTGTLILALIWSVPIVVAVRWSIGRLISLNRARKSVAGAWRAP